MRTLEGFVGSGVDRVFRSSASLGLLGWVGPCRPWVSVARSGVAGLRVTRPLVSRDAAFEAEDFDGRSRVGGR